MRPPYWEEAQPPRVHTRWSGRSPGGGQLSMQPGPGPKHVREETARWFRPLLFTWPQSSLPSGGLRHTTPSCPDSHHSIHEHLRLAAKRRRSLGVPRNEPHSPLPGSFASHTRGIFLSFQRDEIQKNQRAEAEPWPVQLSGLGIVPQSKRSPVRFPVMAQPGLQVLSPVRACATGNRSMFLSCISVSLPLFSPPFPSL